MLHTYGGGLPAYQKTTVAFMAKMREHGVNSDDIFIEYLDLQRSSDVEYRRKLTELLRQKYGARHIGLIVTVHTQALEFLLDDGKALLPEAPVFAYLNVRPELIEMRSTERRVLQRPQNQDMKGTLEMALKMFPDTRKVVFVTGTAPGDRRFEYEARRVFDPWRDKLEFDYTSNRSVEEILRLVKDLPSRSIIIYSNVFSDTTGRTFTPLEIGRAVASTANSPVFCLWDTLMGYGPIGGSLLSFEVEGGLAAEMALKILDKKILLTRPVTTLPASKTFMFDWRQLRRWNVREGALPSGSIVVNKQRTWWDLRYYFVGALTLIVAETLLIVLLVVQGRRREAAEESSRNAVAKYRRIFENATEGIYESSPEGQCLTANPAMVKMLGYDSEEEMHRSINNSPNQIWVDKDDRARLVQLLHERNPVLGFEAQIKRKDGKGVWVSIDCLRVGRSEGQTLYYSSFIEDITNRRRAEQDALDTRREVLRMERRLRMGELSASLSHELNQPLTAIQSNASAALRFLKSGNYEASDVEEILQDIVADNKRAGEIIRGLRAMVKPDEGEKEHVSITETVQGAVALFHSEAIIRNVHVQTNLVEPPPLVDVNKVQIQQVLINLMMNAADAMLEEPGKKVITIQTSTPRPEVVQVAVRDAGSGVAEEDMEKIFGAFFTTKRSGLGMGLSLSLSIVQSHGGHIWAENNPDRGATFYFDLPATVHG